MRHSAIFATAAATLALLAAAPAHADDGWYFSAGTGINYVPDLKVSNTLAKANPAKVESGLGMTITGAGGYAFGPVRVEGEFGWRNNGIDKVTTPALGKASGTGELEPLSFMANAYYDIGTGTRWTPYIGGGIGAVYLNGKIEEAGTTLTEMGRTAFGYQGIGGVAYKVNDALSLKGEYRYLATVDTEMPNEPGVGAGTAKMAYESHAVLVGFIYRFGAKAKPMPAVKAAAFAAAPAPKAPEPPPAVVQPHAFQVFFDFDKSTIRSDARKTIEQAAAIVKAQGNARIDLTGHTDTVGTAAYNMKLSIRRAEAVKKVLVELGIPAGEIGVVGKGKTDLLVQTPDGVREPKNRRVEIVLPQ
jgi:outer membrane protein OmpA-like peptidoglycan-associated protein